MESINLLFVCSRNRWRSPTARQIFQRDPRFNVRDCGVSSSAARRITGDDLAWADIVFVMEKQQRQRILARHGEQLGDTPIHILDIPDEYEFMDPDLIELLKDRVTQALLLRTPPESPGIPRIPQTTVKSPEIEWPRSLCRFPPGLSPESPELHGSKT